MTLKVGLLLLSPRCALRWELLSGAGRSELGDPARSFPLAAYLLRLREEVPNPPAPSVPGGRQTLVVAQLPNSFVSSSALSFFAHSATSYLRWVNIPLQTSIRRTYDTYYLPWIPTPCGLFTPKPRFVSLMTSRKRSASGSCLLVPIRNQEAGLASRRPSSAACGRGASSLASRHDILPLASSPALDWLGGRGWPPGYFICQGWVGGWVRQRSVDMSAVSKGRGY